MPNYFPQNGSFNDLGGVSIGFYINDTDDSSDPKYYGFSDHRGVWIIMKETTSAGSFRYATGKSDYATNWTGRAALSYDYYSELT